MKTSEAKYHNIWEQKDVTVQVPEESASQYKEGNASMPHEMLVLQKFYVLVLFVKPQCLENGCIESNEDIVDVAMVRNDAADAYGIDCMEQKLVHTQGDASVFKEDPQYEEQKEWEMPVYICRSDKPSDEKMKSIIEHAEKHESSSIIDMLHEVFGAGQPQQ